MAKLSRSFSTVTQSDLDEMFDVENIQSVKVGRWLEANLLIRDAYNEKSQTLCGYPFDWIEGNSIVIEYFPSAVKRESVYRTINSKPFDYDKLVQASILLSMDEQRTVSLAETFGRAVDSLLTKLGAGDGRL